MNLSSVLATTMHILCLGKSALLPEIIGFHSQTCHLVSFKLQLYPYLHKGKVCVLHMHTYTYTLPQIHLVSSLCFQHTLSRPIKGLTTLCYNDLFIGLFPLNAVSPLSAEGKSSPMWQSLLLALS